MSETEQSEEKEGGTSMSSVHSANNWESAKFDDNAQRQKFLRLMGGMKEKHTGRFVIGDTHEDAHTRTDAENKEMAATLEHQYQVGLEKKMTGQNKRHVGLGFSEPEEEDPKQPAGTHTQFGDDDTKEGSAEDRADEPGSRSSENDGKDPGDRGRRDARDRDDDREGKEEGRKDRDEKRRDDGSRRRSSRDEEGGSLERHRDEERDKRSGRRSREDKHRDRNERDRGQAESRPKDTSEESSRHDDGKHRRREESDETTEQKRKKRKESKKEDDGSDSQ